MKTSCWEPAVKKTRKLQDVLTVGGAVWMVRYGMMRAFHHPLHPAPSGVVGVGDGADLW